MFTLFSVLFLYFCIKITNGEDNYVENYQNCICVPYWKCKEDYSGLVEDGIDVIDIRFQNLSIPSQTKLFSKLLRNSIDSPAGPCTGDFDVCCQIECGKRRSTIELTYRNYNENILGFRILGEKNEARFAEFPWMLGILNDKTYRCGASLIHPQVALTAAHCLTGDGPFRVRAGEWNWESWNEPIPHQDRSIQKTIVHPKYHPASLRNDIALIILETPFQLLENVGIACLPQQNSFFDYRKCMASGWGKNSYKKGMYQSTLKKVVLPIVPRIRCQTSLQIARLGPLFSLHNSFICAGGEENRDTCKGDGGSPLICPVQGQPERYEQIGIVSWGLTCGVQNTPGVYVNVALFSDWIDKEMMLHNFDVSVYRYRK